jgi:hypothetical protein
VIPRPAYFEAIRERAARRWEQLEADAWGLLDKSPDTYALILASPSGGATEVSGGQLRSLRESGYLKVYVASYRIAVEL